VRTSHLVASAHVQITFFFFPFFLGDLPGEPLGEDVEVVGRVVPDSATGSTAAGCGATELGSK
jgi:hypothetical protein